MRVTAREIALPCALTGHVVVRCADTPKKRQPLSRLLSRQQAVKIALKSIAKKVSYLRLYLLG